MTGHFLAARQEVTVVDAPRFSDVTPIVRLRGNLNKNLTLSSSTLVLSRVEPLAFLASRLLTLEHESHPLRWDHVIIQWFRAKNQTKNLPIFTHLLSAISLCSVIGCMFGHPRRRHAEFIDQNFQYRVPPGWGPEQQA